MEMLTLTIYSLIAMAGILIVYALVIEALASLHNGQMVTVSASSERKMKQSSVHLLAPASCKNVA